MKAVEFAMKMGLACESEITRTIFLPGRTIFIRILPKDIRLPRIKTPYVLGEKCPLLYLMEPKGQLP
jgi:aspartyl-tRNA(Asn)/glutamyl-tRNA(Gln) amidotransferase subunit B